MFKEVNYFASEVNHEIRDHVTCTSFLRYLVIVEWPNRLKNIAKRAKNKKLRHTPIRFITFEILFEKLVQNNISIQNR